MKVKCIHLVLVDKKSVGYISLYPTDFLNRYIFRLDNSVGTLFTNIFNNNPGVRVKIDNDIIIAILFIQSIIVLGADWDDVMIENTNAIRYNPNNMDVKYDIKLTV